MQIRIEPCLFLALTTTLVLLSSMSFAVEAPTSRADVNLVRALYANFAGEAVWEDLPTQNSSLDQPQTTLLRYFTSELPVPILRDRKCVARVLGICHLDFSPLWASQDPTGATVSMVGLTTLGRVHTTVRYPGAEARDMVFQLAPTSIGWSAADIAYAGDRLTLSQTPKAEP
ncbi:MAG: hypothetical protein ACTS5I_06430 [Rhodanobacter sp.]